MITSFKKIKKRGITKNIFFPIFLGLISLVIIGFLAVSNWRISQKRAELQEKIDILNKEYQILKEEVAGLEANLSYTETEDYKTEKLYEEGYFPEGSDPVVVKPPEEKTAKEEKTVEEKNPWQKFLDVLGL